DITATAHADGQAQGGHTVEIHPGCRRVHVAARDGRHIAQPEYLALGLDAKVTDGLHRIEIAADLYPHLLIPRLRDAGRLHGVDGLQRLDDLVRVDAQSRQFGVDIFDIDAVILITEHADLMQMRHPQERLARGVGVILQLRVIEAPSGQYEDVA